MLGLPVQAAVDNSFGFAFERSGLLTMTPSDDGERLIVSLAREQSRYDVDFEMRVLESAGFDPSTQSFLHTGLSNEGSVVVAVEIDENSADLPAIDSAVRRLIETHEALR